MTIAPRIQICLLLTLATAAGARSADAPLAKPLATSSPERGSVPRGEPRPVSRREIFEAIQSALAQRGILTRGKLRPEDLRIQSSVPAVRGDMGLIVKSISLDPLRRETVFELWASHEPEYLPFEVTTRCDPDVLMCPTVLNGAEVRGEVVTKSLESGLGASQGRAKLPVLAKPGTPVTLIMLGQNVRITTTVDPLQPGSKGQRILVRDPATARIMTAEVMAEGLLEASF